MRSGTFVLGPAEARLQVLTRRAGLAARGRSLVGRAEARRRVLPRGGGRGGGGGPALPLGVTRWGATLVLGGAPSLELPADPRSLTVESGTGGVKPLGDRDRRDILRT